MTQYPPKYGLVVADKEEKDETEKVRLSVLKGLWFPILTTCTNLVMDRQSNLQKEGLDCFFRILDRAAGHFEPALWNEILSQVLLPLLEDINLALISSHQNKKQREIEFYIINAKNVLNRFSDFFYR